MHGGNFAPTTYVIAAAAAAAKAKIQFHSGRA